MVLLGFAASSLMVSYVHAQGTPRPRRSIELSETNSAEILTNLNQLTTKKEGGRQLEDQLNALRGLSTRNPIEGRFNTPYVSPTVSTIPTKTLKDLLERQKNWGLTPEELGTGIAASDSDALSAYGEANGQKSSLRQFYDELNRSGAGRQNANPFKDNSSLDSSKRSDFRQQNASDDANLPPGIRDKAQKLEELVNEDAGSIFSPAKARSSFENFFGVTAKSTAPEVVRGQNTAMESFMDQFKKVLDGQTLGAKLDPSVNALLPDTTARRAPTYPTLEPLPSSTHHELTQSTPGRVNSIADRSTLPDLNAAVLNQWNPMYTPPKLELPKITPPTPPNMEFPRRRF